MSVPTPVGIAMIALFLGGNGIAIAHRLFWHRKRPLFWLVSALIGIGIGYMIVSGSAERMLPSLWPVPFDPVKTEEFKLRAPCLTPRMLGAMLVLVPVMVVVVPILLFKYVVQENKRTGPAIVLSVCFSVCSSVFFFSPIPEKLAPLVFSQEALEVPEHCRQPSQ